MTRRVVVGDLRVQQIRCSDGRRSWAIVWPEGTEHAEADRFLRKHEGSGTQRTYAYVLVDHLRWLERGCLTLDTVRLRDLERYMGSLGAEVRMPLGEPWRAGKRPLEAASRPQAWLPSRVVAAFVCRPVVAWTVPPLPSHHRLRRLGLR
jgi:hypothetical protein